MCTPAHYRGVIANVKLFSVPLYVSGVITPMGVIFPSKAPVLKCGIFFERLIAPSLSLVFLVFHSAFLLQSHYKLSFSIFIVLLESTSDGAGPQKVLPGL